MAEVLSHLAHLIDQSIELRGVGIGVRDFAAGFLRVGTTQLVAATARLKTMAFQLAGLAFGEDLAAHPAAAVIGEDQEEPPCWEILDLGELRLRVPLSLAAAFPGGEPVGCPAIVAFDTGYNGPGFSVTVFSRAWDGPAGQAYLDDLLERSQRRTNPFKGRVLETVSNPALGLTFKVVDLPVTRREGVVLPEGVWEEVDHNVHGFFAAFDSLKAAGLARNRGLLLEGPPGTGKTALCRAVAGELEGCTVVFCDATSVAHSVRDLYRELEHLSPALVVMEDVDLVVGNRKHSGGSEALNNFLLALDGAISEHEGVVTIATTNDVWGIDEAARRAARFDRTITVPAPDTDARARILAGYLRPLEVDVDVARVAACTAGASGADLRELVSLAVLHAAGDQRARGEGRVTTDLLLRLAAQRSPVTPVGQYL